MASQQELRTAKDIIRRLLLSADCEWENRNMGHDWADMCQEARQFLTPNAISASPPTQPHESTAAECDKADERREKS